MQWLLHTGREALGTVEDRRRIGVVIGNLAFPSVGMNRFAERVWLGDAMADAAGLPDPPASDRFTSGLPAHLMAKALGLGGAAFALDAACASSLYAIKLACDRLHDRTADVMLAGAVNRADDLFIHVGFCALQAMSKTGQSRPFHSDADGLVPAEGAGMIALKRLADARRDGDVIHGIIRGVGLSNDGRGGGLLVPSQEGQIRAMRRAYAEAGLTPADISLVECHATGTPVGDKTEIESMGTVFEGLSEVPIGSLKSNLGHLITAAGVGGLIKVLGAMKAGVRPPTLHAAESIHESVGRSPFRLLNASEPWTSEGPRRAAISAFGFGGNNGHLIVEEPGAAPMPESLPLPPEPIAIVAIGAAVGSGEDLGAFEQALFSPVDGVRGRAEGVSLPIAGLRFPPNDLKQTLPQQLMVLRAASEAVEGTVAALPRETTGVVIGMSTDPNVARYGARWRLAQWASRWGIDDPAWLDAAREAFVPGLKAAGVVGTMPNIPANRLNSQFDLAGPSLAVCAEELSGVRALEIAVRALQRFEMDAAIVGAVDLSDDPVHRAALSKLGLPVNTGDAAISLVLRRLGDAQDHGEDVLAVIDPGAKDAVGFDSKALEARFGRAHAAWGLLQVAAAALSCARGLRPGGEPWSGERAVTLALDGLEGQRASVTVRSEGAPVAPRPKSQQEGRALRFSAHAPEITLPPLPAVTAIGVGMKPRQPAQDKTQLIPQPPAVPPVLEAEPQAPRQAVAPQAPVAAPIVVPPAPAPVAPPVATAAPVLMQPEAASTPMSDVYARIAAHQAQFSAAHQQFMTMQSDAHQQFLAMRQRTQSAFLGMASMPAPHHAPAPVPLPAALPLPTPAALPTVAFTTPAPVVAQPAPAAPRPAAPTPAPTRPVVAAPKAAPARPASQQVASEPEVMAPTGMTLDREGLKIHASGKISEIFGPMFEQQDGFARQVRMPEPPLLLADRMTGLVAEPGSMGKGTLWTETDVREDSWFLHEGRMPAGIMIESGQADLMLISYLGADFLNQDERIYRLLGCELTWHDHLPKPGETLVYDIHVDGHANQGDVRLFFFHYDCRIAGKSRLTVRHGQAGFFTKEELDNSGGILWTAETGEHCENPRLDAPEVLSEKRRFVRRDLEAFAAGDALTCFGPGFEKTAAHTNTPRISGGRMLFLDEVVDFDVQGGPWGRGYLKAIDPIAPDDWFFDGHFKNDPCMPGTLMFEGCLQAMAFAMSAMGMTIERDGWRFEPIPEETYKMRCRGQVTPTSKELIYEVFIEEIIAGPVPMIYADLLCTVDGLGAFHCRRMGLRLVPEWPMNARPDLLQPPSEVPVATFEGFPFDYNSLLACAWGQPTHAFGQAYAPYDSHRQVPRLPGPPYHFISRVLTIDGEPWSMKSGVRVVVEYDVPPEAWYFSENGAATMPFCVLLEAALQPCGWLASLSGSTLGTDKDVSFRNLDGTGKLLTEVWPDAGVLTTEVKITNVSRSAGMIIESFEVLCSVAGVPVYEMSTVFGFFPSEALAAQKGLPNDGLPALEGDALDLTSAPSRYFEGSARLSAPSLLMIDRIVEANADGGEMALGAYRAEKRVDPREWFFKAHFFQDPVQPGSLGVEAMVQVLQFAMLHQNLDHGIEDPRFEPLGLGEALTWKYRGQVLTHNDTITTTLEITEKGEDEWGRWAVAKASLWVDGMRIYEATGLGMRIVSGGPEPVLRETVLDPSTDTWLMDHCPTWTVPALPMMSMADLIASAGVREGRLLTGLKNVRIARWLPVTGPTSVKARTRGLVSEVDVTLENEDGAIASGTVLAAMARVAGPAPWKPLDAPLIDDPYEGGALFHGPAFQALKSLKMGPNGASAVLDASPGDIPVGLLNPRLLDASLHAIPHDALHQWSDDIPEDMVAYPAQIIALSVHGPTPVEGEVRCEVRFYGFLGNKRFPRFGVQLIHRDQVWVSYQIVEALFPKGPLGTAPPQDRRAFLRDALYVPGVALSDFDGKETRLPEGRIEASDWLPGTVSAIYGTQDPVHIAVREHIARRVGFHPRDVLETLPLSDFPLEVERGENGDLFVKDAGPESLDLSPVKAFWSTWFEREDWPVADLYYGLIERFVRRVVTPDPASFEALQGVSCLFLGNHQVAVESLLFSIVTSGLLQVPTVTLAKAEHRHTWLGKLIAHCFSYPETQDPKVITFFDREDKASLPKIIGELAAEMHSPGRSVLVHVEGTRALSCRTPVQKMSGAFIDMAMKVGAPIVPVRFVGALPTEPLETRLEFPLGMGQQDIWIGAPMWPEELAAVPYGERKRRVVEAINALGPDNADEAPLPGDPSLAASSEGWAAKSGASAEHATLYRILQGLDQPCAQTQAMLAAVEGGALETDADAPTRAWLEEMLRRLSGA